jgi:protein-tyrosine-phosphatase
MAARNVLRELGVHALEHHIARGLSPALLDGADWIFTMTRAQRRSIIDLFPETASRVRLLSQRGMEIEDPAQATEDQYRIVRDQILAALRDLPRRLKETF